MVDVFDEVEEELRNERYQAFARKWGPWIGAGAAAIVLTVAGNQFLTWRAGTISDAASAQYLGAAEALEEADLARADGEFAALVDDGPRGYATLSLMRRGEIALENGDAEAAARLYEQAAERAPDAITRDLARYKAALARFDELSYDDLQVRLRPLTEGAAPFGALARELIAAAAVREERWDEARSAYQLLALTLDASPGVARRAGEALAYIRQVAPAPVEPEPVEATPELDVPSEPGLDDSSAADDASVQGESSEDGQ